MQNFGTLFELYGAYFFLGLLGLNLFLVFWVFLLKKKLSNIFRNNSLDIGGVILELRRNQDNHEKELYTAKNRLESLESAKLQGVSKVGLVRHNPFSDSGGDQSFAVALLNDQKDGIVVSSLYGRTINRVFAKPIEKGKSKYQLSSEEEQAIAEAFR